MYAALVNKKLIYAVNYQPQKANKLECPKCLGMVRFIKSKGKKPYFKHFSKVSKNDETYEHRQLKQQIYHILNKIYPEVFLEKTISSDKVRPDILIKQKTQKLAIEIQCSPLGEQIHEYRHNYYRQFSIKDIWLVGEKLHLHQRLAKKHIRFLRYQKNLGFHLFELHLNSQKIKLKYHIMRQDLSTKVNYHMQVFGLNSSGINQLIKFVKQDRRIKRYQELPIKWHKNQKELETIKHLAYANGYNFKKLLAECYTSYRQPYFLSSETTEKIKAKIGISNDIVVYLPITLRHLDSKRIEEKKNWQFHELFN
ncbi:competence protein CoiA [Holzapfeliella floricola]|uniref:competence protein CoiA n=1 Tax=Holzapfeliella floricola TaxID=679249 RepID=UPI0007048B99|nr:competence protein CoiA family protein [Holzapfeliella floricola]